MSHSSIESGARCEPDDLTWVEPQTPEQIMDDLLKIHKKTEWYVLFSGGKDSVSVAHYISANYPEHFKGVVFTNTGIASPITRKFVISYCKEMGWPLFMTWPPNKSYYEIVMKHGFPGPGSHRIVMGYLKYHSWYYFLRGMRDTSAFISGVRKKESHIRNKKRFYTRTPIDIDDGIVFCKPFLYKNGSQLMEYFITNGLKKSPAYEWYNKSGECWCGCFYNDWELKMIEKQDPFLYGIIQWLESQVRLHGTATAKLNPNWGRSVGADLSRLQTTLGEYSEDYCGESCAIE